MISGFERGFQEELEKIAVTLAQLRKAVTRIGPRVFPHGSPLAPFKGLMIPTKGQAKAIKKLPKWQEGLMTPELKGVLEGEFRRNPGRIYISKDVGELIDPFAGVRRGRHLKTFTTAHEAFERGTKPSRVHFSTFHISPEVLAKEMNLLSRLTGKGSKGVQESVRELREAGGEYPAMRRMLEESFGPRAVEFTQKGKKIPKALRKRLATVGGELTEADLEKAQKGLLGLMIKRTLKRGGAVQKL